MNLMKHQAVWRSKTGWFSLTTVISAPSLSSHCSILLPLSRASGIKNLDGLGGPMVKNLPCNARGHQFDRWCGKIPHATEELSLCITSAEPMLHKKRSHCNEKPSHHNQRRVPALCNQRKPKCTDEEPVQPKITYQKKTPQMIGCLGLSSIYMPSDWH